MKQHLSEKEIAGWIMGERTPVLQSHVSECPECRKQLDALSRGLLHFRRSTHEWSRMCQPPARLPEPVRWRRLLARWAFAAAAFLLIASVPVYQSSKRHREARELAYNQARDAADAALLKQVDTGISRAVPETMEPLVSLVSWSSGSAAGQ